MTTSNQIAKLDWAGIDAFDAYLGTKYIGTLAATNTSAVRAYFNGNGTRGSKRRFPNAQVAIAFLIARREKRMAAA